MNDNSIFEKQIALGQDIMQRFQNQIDDENAKSIDSVGALENDLWYGSSERLIELVFGAESDEFKRWVAVMDELHKAQNANQPYNREKHLNNYLMNYKACIVLLTEFDAKYRFLQSKEQ